MVLSCKSEFQKFPEIIAETLDHNSLNFYTFSNYISLLTEWNLSTKKSNDLFLGCRLL